MDLSLSDEQIMLRDSAARYIRDHYSVELKRRLRDSELGFSRENWKQFAEFGWLALPFSEDDGGLGGGALDVAVLMEEFGRGLVAEPYLITVMLCGAFLSTAEQEQRESYISSLIAGETQWAFAFAEQHGRYNLANVTLSATPKESGWILEGEKIAVLNGAAADFLIVSARTMGRQCDREGISLFVVDVGLSGIERMIYPLVDGSMGADVCFNGVTVSSESLLGDAGTALPRIEDVIGRAIIGIGAEGLGAMDAMLEQTIEYTLTRKQFGQAIGEFQVLQHRMVDMYLNCQALRSLLYNATMAREGSRDDMLQAAYALKVKLGEAGRFVSQQAVQLHGGIGMTDELAIGHYFKRLLLLNTLFGDSEYYLDRYVDSLSACGT